MARKIEPGDALERRLREASNRRSEPLRHTATRLLEEHRNGRAEVPAQPTVAVSKRPKRSKARGATKSRGVSSKADAAARTEVNELVTKEAQRHGDYRLDDFKLQEVTEGGKRKDKTIRVVRNFGSSPIVRWHNGGSFDERQMAAILFYQEAFRKVHGEGTRMTASYSPVIVRGAIGSIELYAATAFAAKVSLRLLDREVFFREPVDHFHVWQNVVIWEKPAGVAGAGAGFIVKKAAEARAKTIVQGMAHKIADVVIDQSRRDYRELLLDIDAPRRPGSRTA